MAHSRFQAFGCEFLLLGFSGCEIAASNRRSWLAGVGGVMDQAGVAERSAGSIKFELCLEGVDQRGVVLTGGQRQCLLSGGFRFSKTPVRGISGRQHFQRLSLLMARHFTQVRPPAGPLQRRSGSRPPGSVASTQARLNRARALSGSISRACWK